MGEVALNDSRCAHCGLPIGLPLIALRANSPRTGSPYCCWGCRFAAAIQRDRGDAGQRTLLKLGVSIFFAMNVMVFTMALWTQDIYRGDAALDARTALVLYELFRYLCLLLSLPVLLLLGAPLAEDAFADLRRGALTTNVLLVVGVAAAFVYSLTSVIRGAGHVYFEVVCMVLVAVTLGRWLEATCKSKAADALQSLHKLLPDQVRLQTGDTERFIELAELQRGQAFRVLAGERIPADGRIEEGRAAIDEQLVTGEAQPVDKEPGQPVVAGTLNLDGVLLIRATAAAGEGTIQRLVDAVTEAAAVPGRDQRLADRLASWFTPFVVAAAVVTFAAQGWSTGYATALMSGLAVVLIACPCALGIATPLALWAGLGRAARGQVLFRDGDALSRLAGVRSMCFDKTGTLTLGEPRVERFISDGETGRELAVRNTAALARCSTHSFSRALCRMAGTAPGEAASVAEIRELKTLPGRGIQGAVTGTPGNICLGSVRLMEESGLVVTPPLEVALARARERAEPVTCVGWDGRVRGVFVFSEQLRAAAKPAVDALRRLGLRLTVLTGDHHARATGVHRDLGIEVTGRLLPHDKQSAIELARRRHGSVAMVGDGINDAPALAAADVGIAMGCGADISREAADVCLLGSDLERIPWAIELARRTKRTIRQNLLWAFGYNLCGMGLAATGMLNPVIAAVAMIGSSLFVITNSLRLASFDTGTSVENAVRPQPAMPGRLGEFGA